MPTTNGPTCILVHGGAGDRGLDADEAAAKAGCLQAVRAGHAILQSGGSALEAVLAAVQMLEDDVEFNAGCGSALTRDGHVEMDASVMLGDGRSGAVGAVTTVKNPIHLARAVMEKTPHLLLVGPGAELFAQEIGVPRIDNTTMVTPRARARLLAHRQSHGTVGAVARDALGTVAAATSTGGTMGKRPGRLGDSCLIGCGTWASNDAGAASATGHGETIVRAGLTRFAVELLAQGRSPRDAAQQAMARLQTLGGTGGIILCTPRAELGFAFNTSHMPWAFIDAQGLEEVGLSTREPLV